MKSNVLLLLISFILSFSLSGQQKLRVACIGNSITAGGYPQLMQQQLGDDWEVKNYGVSGTTMLRNGDYPYFKTEMYAEARAFRPDVVIIKLGTNDSKPQNWKHSNEFVADYRTMINELHQLPSHPFIIICYPVKVYSQGWDINDSIIRNEQLPMIKKIARKKHVRLINLYKPLSNHSAWFPDGIHPNEEGSAKIAEVIKEHLIKWKKKIVARQTM